MPDIFISYSKIDRAHALKLANELKKRSFNVWWDDELYASQDYHDVIMSVLNDCKVAVVIWSPDAIKSKWVRDEARRALSKEKLIPTYLPPFNLDNVPLGFGDIQTVDVNDLDEILKALRPFCKPSEPPTAPPTPANSPAPTKTRPIADYDAISNFTSELEDYERQYPARSEAFVTLRNALKYSHTSKTHARGRPSCCGGRVGWQHCAPSQQPCHSGEAPEVATAYPHSEAVAALRLSV